MTHRGEAGWYGNSLWELLVPSAVMAEQIRLGTRVAGPPMGPEEA